MGGLEVNATARDEGRGSMTSSGGEAASLVESAMLLRWRAPELALLLADRAVAAAGNDRSTVVRADHLAVVTLNRLGRHGAAAHRLLPVLQHADIPAELLPELQVELAHCAAALGEPGTALAALCPVLAAGDDAAPLLRGTALIATAESCAALGRGDLVPSALEEADELFREDPQLDRDTALLLRATAKAVDAARHRRGGGAVESEAQARMGRELLTGLADPEHDSGQISARLMLETVLGLLDRGEGDTAVYEARPMLRRPVRAAAAGAVGWLRLAIATRVHLAKGRHEPALGLLADAVEVAQRHGVDAVLAECLEGLSHVHEVRGEFADALHCLRSARAAERRHRRSIESARCAILEHCGVARREVPRVIDQVAGLLPAPGWLRAVPDPDTGLLDSEEYDCRVDAALTGSAAHSQVLIAVGPGTGDDPPGTGLMVELSRRLRRAAPAGAALGQITSGRIAVLLPGMSRHQAQLWADRFRAVSAAQLGAQLTVGVAEYRAGTGADQFLVDTVAALCAATRVAPTRRDPAKDETPVIPDRKIPEPATSNGGTSDPVNPDTVILEVVSGRTSTAEGSRQVTDHPPDVVEQAAPDPGAEVVLARPEVEKPLRSDDSAEIASAAEEPGLLSGSFELLPGAQGTSAQADDDLPAAAEDLPAADLPSDEDLLAESESAPGTRHRRGVNGTPVLVSDLLPLSVLSAGRSGRRRAKDRAEDNELNDNLPGGDHLSDSRADQLPIARARWTSAGFPGENGTGENGTGVAGSGEDRSARDGVVRDGHSPARPQTGPMLSLAPFGQSSLSEPTALDAGVNGSVAADDLDGMAHVSHGYPVAGPPPAPLPRALEWGSNGSVSRAAKAADVGMGDLLAEALAAFQESGHSLGAGTDTSGANSVDAAPGRGPWGRTSGVQLAADRGDRRASNDSDALTDPELRLPDLTAEPLWQPPGTGRRSAAGD